MAARRAPDFDADVSEFIDLAKHLRGYDAALYKAMKKNVRAAVKPAVVAIRAEVLKAPSTRGLRTGKQAKAAKARGSRPRLRQGIARGIRIDYADTANARRVGVFVRATSAALPPSQKGMQRTYNQPVFRRRVFGTDEWVEQAGHPYFDGPIRKRRNATRIAVAKAIEDAKHDLGLS